jgi:hypothetical protein
MRKLLIASGTVLIAVALAACGGGDSGASKSDQFATDYKPLNAKLLATGQLLNTTIKEAPRTKNAELATDFTALARRLREVGDGLRRLDPPADARGDLDELTTKTDAVRVAFSEVAAAAAKNDRKAANAATAAMLRELALLNNAQNKVAADTGAARGAN